MKQLIKDIFGFGTELWAPRVVFIRYCIVLPIFVLLVWLITK